MNTVRENDRPRSTPAAAAAQVDDRHDYLEAQGRALRIVALLLVLAFSAAGLGISWALSAGTPAQVAAAPAADLSEVSFPIQVNDRVEDWMYRYLTTQRPQFQAFLDREGIYSGMIREKLRSRGMPEELIYLAMIESGFVPQARSRVAATGMWQFMGPTARQYGLRVDEWVDERRDPVKATDAALDYLEALHGRFGSWYLAAAAYNAGPSRVSRVVRRHGGATAGDEDLYWEILDQLPLETRVYVPKILAATLLAREADTFGFQVAEAVPYTFDQVFAPGQTPLRTVAETLDLPVQLLRDLNPHLVRGVTPPGISYPLRVPVGKGPQVVALLNARGVRRAD
jgi:membrane-bound lytic murein transglycosylase D